MKGDTWVYHRKVLGFRADLASDPGSAANLYNTGLLFSGPDSCHLGSFLRL